MFFYMFFFFKSFVRIKSVKTYFQVHSVHNNKKKGFYRIVASIIFYDPAKN